MSPTSIYLHAGCNSPIFGLFSLPKLVSNRGLSLYYRPAERFSNMDQSSAGYEEQRLTRLAKDFHLI